MSKLDWIATVCAPKNYPVKVLGGLFLLEGDSNVAIPSGKVIANAWGEPGALNLSEPTLLTFPLGISVLWFSYRENKFYECDEELPVALIEDIMQNGFDVPFEEMKVKADKIIVGLAPGGDIALWAASSGVVKEICILKGKETTYDWNLFLDNSSISRLDYISLILNEKLGSEEYAKLKLLPISIGKWLNYSEKYKWTPRIVVIAHDIQLWIKRWNGESQFFRINDINQELQINPASLPSELLITYKNNSENHYEIQIRLDEAETFSTFRRFSETSPETPVKLIVEISDASKQVSVFVADDKKFYELKRIDVKKFKA